MTEPLRISLEIHVRDDEVAGRAMRAGQPDRCFSGWVELLAVLDALIEPSGAEA